MIIKQKNPNFQSRIVLKRGKKINYIVKIFIEDFILECSNMKKRLTPMTNSIKNAALNPPAPGAAAAQRPSQKEENVFDISINNNHIGRIEFEIRQIFVLKE